MTIPVTDVLGRRTSQLGLGCASVGGRVSLRDGRRAIDRAFEAGITHFDVARSYGYGLAEVALQPLLRRRRDQVTIATKAGIESALHPLTARILGSAARTTRRVLPRHHAARSLAGTTLVRPPLRVESLETSFAASLNALGTADTDVLFLHEPSIASVNDEILRWLEHQRTTGRANMVGIATTEPVSDTHRSMPAWLAYQVAYEHLTGYLAAGLNVVGTHSIFRGSRQGDQNPLIEAAAHGVVCVASMYSPGHLERNRSAFSEGFKRRDDI